MDERGCTVNANGTLKDASEIDWSHSRSPSPVLSAIPESIPVAKLTRPASHDEVMDLGNPCKKQQKENPRQPLTSAQPQPKLWVNLTYHDKIKIMEFAEGAGRGLSQTAIARNFHGIWPSLSQDNISKILKDCKALKHY